MEPVPATEPVFPQIEVDVFAKEPQPEEKGRKYKKRSIPVPKLHKATGQSYAYYKGKTYYFGVYGSTKAQEKYLAFRAKFGKQVAEGYMVHELTTRYGKEVKLSAKAQYHVDILKDEMGSFINLACNQFGPLAFREVRKLLAASGTRTAETINSTMATLQRMFRWGVSVQAVTVDVYTGLKTVPPLKPHEVTKQAKGRYLVSMNIVEATLPFLFQHVQHAVRLQLLTGARPNEILGIRKSLMEKVGPNGTWVYRLEKHKTAHKGKKRFLVLGPQAQAVYQGQCELHPESDWLFPSEESATGHYKPNGYMRAVRTGAKEAGQPHWTPYQLRHLRLTQIARDYGIEAAANIAGHTGTGMTQGYAHGPDAKDIRNATGTDEKPATHLDLVDSMERLVSMRENGWLTEDEFRVAKGRLLG